MAQESRGVVRDNIFIVAAIALPLVVVAFFVLSSIVPRWTVPPPAYDLLLRATDYYPTTPRMTVEYQVRGETVVVTVAPLAANSGYPARWKLFLFDHGTMNVREIPVDLQDVAGGLKESDAPRTIAVAALAGRRVLAQTTAPDGYRFENRDQHGAGVVGELFGMNRYDARASLVNRGRVIPISLPPGFPNVYGYPVYALGWIAAEPAGAR